MSAKQFTFEQARLNLKQKFPFLELLSYNGSKNFCFVKDIEFNTEFLANTYSDLFRGNIVCAARKQFNRAKSLEKNRKTNLEKYGVENPFQNEEVKKKIKQTNLEKYGVENPSQNKDIQKKIKKTNLEKYGEENVLKNKKIREKIKETNLERYGVESPIQNEEIKKKIKQTNLEKYGEIHPLQRPKTREKALSTLITNYGVIHPSLINPLLIDNLTVKELSKKIKLSDSYIRRLIKDGIDLYTYRRGETLIERKIKDFLNELNLSFNQYTKKLKEFHPDFYFPEHNLVIECDGLYWHSEKVLKNQRKYGKHHSFKRREFYNSLGIRLLSFREDQILNKFHIVESIIKNALKLTETKLYARKTYIKEIDKEQAKQFLEENHLMGKGAGKSFGLYYENELVSLIQIKCKNKEKGEFEIARFCNKLNVSVVGGFSKLLKYTIGQVSPRKLITFTDLNYGTGEYLKQFGFIDSKPYSSFKWTNYENVWNRMEFPGNTGEEKGLDRIWDSGQRKWELLISYR